MSLLFEKQEVIAIDRTGWGVSG